jgi:hypothetical protein
LAFLIILLSACATPSDASEVSPYVDVPTYATYRAIMEKVEKSLNIGNTHTAYYVVKFEEISIEAELGFVGVLIPNSQINNLSEAKFEDYGQSCKTEESEDFKLKGASLVIKYDASTDNQEFFGFCDSQIPDSVESYMIYLDPGDGSNRVSWYLSPLPVIAKSNK